MQLCPLISAASPQADSVATLFGWVLGVCGCIFLGIWLATAICSRRFRVHPHEEESTPDPKQIYGSRRLELIWTVIPAIIVGVFAVAAIAGMQTILPPMGDQKPDIIVTGHQWWWEIHYPEHGVVTANEFAIPAGKKTLVQLESADVIHSFWIPELAPKQDMIPGASRHIWLEPYEPGKFSGVCAEFCGTQHAWMRFEISSLAPEEFASWIAKQKAVAAASTMEGAKVFDEMNCRECHSIQGTEATANVAPDLTHFASRETLASGVVPNNRENLTQWLQDPDSIKPGSHMPNFNLSGTDISALVAYLETLR